MRMVAQWVKKARTVTREFRSGVDEMIREAELEEARGAIDMARPSNLEKTIGSTIDPTGSVSDSLGDVEKQTRKVETEARQAARQDDGDSGSAAAASEDGGGATIVEQPTRIAPPHSLKPPPEPGAEDQDDIGLRESGVGLLEVEQLLVGHVCFGEEHVHVPWHSPGNRVDRIVQVDAVLLQRIGELP